MARQTNDFQLRGSLGGLTFYKTKDGYFVRRKSSISKAKIKSHPSFELTRRNNEEFKRAGHGVKLFRWAFRALLFRIGEKGATGQLMRLMVAAIRGDEIHPGGERTLNDGETQLLEGFEFNKNAKVSNILRANLKARINRKTSLATVDIKGPCVAEMVSAPEGATHVRLFSGAAVIDFENDAFNMDRTESDCLPIDRKKTGTIRLSQKIDFSLPGHAFLLFGIEFLNVHNGIEAPVAGGNQNALAIIKTD